MNYDEFAFFNQQLAAMVRDGIPLEGALRRLSEDLHHGSLRTELTALGEALSRGTPITEALAARKLPELYQRLVLVGVKADNLPGTLTMLADYYQRQHNLWVRLKGLMVYPLIVLFVVFLVSGLFALLQARIGVTTDIVFGMNEGRPLPAMSRLTLPLTRNLWIFPAFFGGVFLLALAGMTIPALHQRVRWRLPAFKEASISRVAAGMKLLLQSGIPLPDAVRFVQQLEPNPATAADLGRWREQLAQGVTKFSEVAARNRIFPPLFVWLVAHGGEQLAGGFGRAAELYQSRAEQRAEMTLYAALPVTVMFLGLLVFSEAYLLVGSFLVLIDLMNCIGG